MKTVGVESPLKGMVGERCPKMFATLAERVMRERNRHYAFACMRRELAKGNAPYASHALLDQPGLLEDADASQRAIGIAAGQAHYRALSERVFYTDLGTSAGMRIGADNARSESQKCREALLGPYYKPLPLWRCATIATLRATLARLYK